MAVYGGRFHSKQSLPFLLSEEGSGLLPTEKGDDLRHTNDLRHVSCRSGCSGLKLCLQGVINACLMIAEEEPQNVCCTKPNQSAGGLARHFALAGNEA